jgi:Asp-tRNA(Asn)/Glu-tRNA(Gln) amidotransferase A subunit family amidase
MVPVVGLRARPRLSARAPSISFATRKRRSPTSTRRFSAKTLTCRALVQMYLDRIEAYDKKGPALNAIVVTNPDALKVADALDAKFAQSGPSARSTACR